MKSGLNLLIDFFNLEKFLISPNMEFSVNFLIPGFALINVFLAESVGGKFSFLAIGSNFFL
jgi:hypothetical protein